MADTLLRQWTMMQMLSTRKPLCVEDIRDRLDKSGFPVDVRTIQRDLNNLSRFFPIVSDEKRPQKWSWSKDGITFEIPGMDVVAALTLRMAADYMASLLPQVCMNALEPHMERARAILNTIDNTGLRQWPDKIRTISRTQPLLSPVIPESVLNGVYDGLLKNRQLKGLYQKRIDADPKEFIVHPLGLVINDAVIYLVATIWDYTDLRILAVHRFLSVEVLNNPAAIPPDFNLDDYIASGAFRMPLMDEGIIRLKVLFDKDAVMHLYESRLADNQVLTDQENGDVMLEAEVLDTWQLRKWLLSFGDQVEVLEPKGLREGFGKICDRLCGYYKA